MLKETPRSLRQYFGLVAVLTLLIGAVGLYAGRLTPLLLIISFLTVAFGAMYLYITIKFAELLPKKPAFIKNVLTANLVLRALMFLLSLAAGVRPGALFQIIIALLVYFYLVKSVTRLSAEVAAQMA